MIGAFAVVITGIGLMSSASALQSCQALWAERNSYYKDTGCCFKALRTISYFGNQGCMFDNEASESLPRFVRGRIAEITWLERRSGCN